MNDQHSRNPVTGAFTGISGDQSGAGVNENDTYGSALAKVQLAGKGGVFVPTSNPYWSPTAFIVYRILSGFAISSILFFVYLSATYSPVFPPRLDYLLRAFLILVELPVVLWTAKYLRIRRSKRKRRT